MGEIDKPLFLRFVTETLTKNPGWFGELVAAMQHGLTDAIEKERETVSNLAYGYIDLYDFSAHNIRKRHATRTGKKGLPALAEFFDGAPIVRSIREYIKENEQP